MCLQKGLYEFPICDAKMEIIFGILYNVTSFHMENRMSKEENLKVKKETRSSIHSPSLVQGGEFEGEEKRDF